MAARLVSRQKWIPHGFRYFQPEINFRAPKNASFDQIVQALIRARQANPAKLKQHKWPTDYNLVASEVDRYNAQICLAHGWTDYVIQTVHESVPKTLPPHQVRSLQSLKDAAARAKELVAGAKTLIEWLDSGEAPVEVAEATRRAEICSACPHNNQNAFGHWFTKPASELIRRQIEKLAERSISTIHDEKLNLCDICLCPLKLKVHTPLNHILSKIRPEVLVKLKSVPGCWVSGSAASQ